MCDVHPHRVPHGNKVIDMHIKIIKKKTKRKPNPSGVFRILEYRKIAPERYIGGSWYTEDEVPRRCMPKWVLHTVESRRNGRRVVKKTKYLLTIAFHEVVDTLWDTSPERYVDVFMEACATSLFERCSRNGSAPPGAARKIRTAVAGIVGLVMAEYNEGDEPKIRKRNIAKRLQVERLLAAEMEADLELKRRLIMEKLVREKKLEDVRAVAKDLAKQFFRKALKDYHPDRILITAEADTNEKIILIGELKKETDTEIDLVRQLPPPAEADDEDSPE